MTIHYPLLPFREPDGTPFVDPGWYGPARLSRERVAEIEADPLLVASMFRFNVVRQGEIYGVSMYPDLTPEAIAAFVTSDLTIYYCPPEVHWLSLFRWRLWRVTCLDPYDLPWDWPIDPDLPRMMPFNAFMRLFSRIPWVYPQQRLHPDDVAAHVRWRTQYGIGGDSARNWWTVAGMTQDDIDAELLRATEAEDIRPTGGTADLAAIEALIAHYEHPTQETLENIPTPA